MNSRVYRVSVWIYTALRTCNELESRDRDHNTDWSIATSAFICIAIILTTLVVQVEQSVRCIVCVSLSGQ